MPTEEDTLSSSELASMGIVIDGLPTHMASKLASPGWDQTEVLYLLATYCFDLQRKMQYLYRILNRVTRREADKGVVDPTLQQLARELIDDEQHYNVPGLTWRQRAEWMEKRMLELHGTYAKDRDELLARLAKGATATGVTATTKGSTAKRESPKRRPGR